MSRLVEAADARILELVRSCAPSARVVSSLTRGAYSCLITVDTDAEKKRIQDNASLLEEMRNAANDIVSRQIYVSAESQETVDRRWKGDWNYVFR